MFVSPFGTIYPWNWKCIQHNLFLTWIETMKPQLSLLGCSGASSVWLHWAASSRQQCRAAGVNVWLCWCEARELLKRGALQKMQSKKGPSVHLRGGSVCAASQACSNVTSAVNTHDCIIFILLLKGTGEKVKNTQVVLYTQSSCHSKCFYVLFVHKIQYDTFIFASFFHKLK